MVSISLISIFQNQYNLFIHCHHLWAGCIHYLTPITTLWQAAHSGVASVPLVPPAGREECMASFTRLPGYRAPVRCFGSNNSSGCVARTKMNAVGCIFKLKKLWRKAVCGSTTLISGMTSAHHRLGDGLSCPAKGFPAGTSQKREGG